MASQLSESDFRRMAADLYKRVERQFDEIDPDVAECEVAQGAMTITLGDGKRWVLSMQPPVRQMWLAVASKGRAYHFDYDAARDAWVDDAGEGVELLSYLAELVQEYTGETVQF